MTENHFRMHFSPFQINTQLFFLEIYFTKWLPVAILDDRKALLIAFLAISDQYATFFYFFFFNLATSGHFGSPICAKNNRVLPLCVLVIWDLNGYGEYEFDRCICDKVMACTSVGVRRRRRRRQRNHKHNITEIFNFRVYNNNFLTNFSEMFYQCSNMDQAEAQILVSICIEISYRIVFPMRCSIEI